VISVWPIVFTRVPLSVWSVISFCAVTVTTSDEPDGHRRGLRRRHVDVLDLGRGEAGGGDLHRVVAGVNRVEAVAAVLLRDGLAGYARLAARDLHRGAGDGGAVRIFDVADDEPLARLRRGRGREQKQC
jgi:hypothetical protein